MPKVTKRKSESIFEPISKHLKLHLNTKPHIRNPNFGDEETKCLISLWGNPNIQRTLVTSHKKSPIINTLSILMQQRGYYRSPDEINTRLKNLKCFYNRIKKDIDAGVNDNSKWLHFKAMDAILGKRWNKRESGTYKNPYAVRRSEVRAADLMAEVINEDSEGTELRPEDLLEVEGPSEGMSIKDEPYGDDEQDSDYTEPSSKPLTYIPLKNNSSISIIPKKNNQVGTSTVYKSAASTSGQRISVVPANLLLKPPISRTFTNSEIRPKPSNENGAESGISSTSTPVQNGALPLQVLLLNGLQKQQYAINNFDLKNNMQHKVQTDTELPVLLKQLIEIQNKNLEIEKQKLELKKQRFEFEKSVGSKLVKLVPIFETFISNLTSESRNGEETHEDSPN